MPRRDYQKPNPAAWREYFMHRKPPPWWPLNEPWPPRHRPWRGAGRRSPFFLRLGCLFALFSLLGMIILGGITIIILNGLGLIHGSFEVFNGLMPFIGILLALIISMVVLAGTNLRRMTVPLDEMLTASNRVAEGDYATRVDEKGPPEVLSLTKAFNSMTMRLQTYDQQRRALLADISHELRTPLTIIQGNLEGIVDGLYPADGPRIKSILEETQVLSRLIDDLRILSLVESGTLQLMREPIDLASLIHDVADLYKPQTDSAGVNLELSLATEESIIEVDSERIRQVISNLLANALRYTPKGGSIRLIYKIIRSNPTFPTTAGLKESGGSAEIIIQDSGPGISSSDLPHIFDRFYKANDSHGMGLGLSISKYIIEAHGGEINATSEAGKGTSISFTLPF